MTRPGRACAALEQSKISRKPSQALPTRQTLVDLIAIDRATHQPQLVIFGVWLDARGPARRDQRRLPSHRRARPRSRLINEVEEPAPPLDLAHHSCVRPRRGHPHRRPRRQLARARCPGRQGPQLGQVARVHQRRMPAMGSGEDEPRVETPWQALGAGGHPHRPVVPGDPVPHGARSDPAALDPARLWRDAALPGAADRTRRGLPVVTRGCAGTAARRTRSRHPARVPEREPVSCRTGTATGRRSPRPPGPARP